MLLAATGMTVDHERGFPLPEWGAERAASLGLAQRTRDKRRHRAPQESLLHTRRQEFVFLLWGEDVAGEDPRLCCGSVTIHPLAREVPDGLVANVLLIDRLSPGESAFGI